MEKIIYCDLDGVLANWEGRFIELNGLQKDTGLREFLKKGGKLEERFPDVREFISDMGSSFWEGIKPFYWAKNMYRRLSSKGDFMFLTSPGNHNKRPLYASGGAMGKLLWISRYFNSASASITRDKHFHAHPNAILIDDSIGNIKRFRKYGGKAYHFPHPYKIEDGEIKVENVLSDIENIIDTI